MTGTIVVRTDGLGDLVLAGPAIRAVAARSRVTLVCGPAGAPAAPHLPGVDAVEVLRLPWIDAHPEPVDRATFGEWVDRLARVGADDAVVLTSFHQDPLPAALLLRLAGVGRVGAVSEDYPGALLDVRHHVPDDVHEVERGRSLVAAMGYPRPVDDPDGPLLRLPVHGGPVRRERFVVVHPGATAPARTWAPDRFRALVARLAAVGHDVVVTAGPAEQDLARAVAGSAGRVAGCLPFAQLLRLLASATAVVAGNTGPAHVAAAVGTPVVSLFPPTVPAARWRPYGVPHVLLGDQHIECAGCRAHVCPRSDHACVDIVATQDVVDAVEHLTLAEAVA